MLGEAAAHSTTWRMLAHGQEQTLGYILFRRNRPGYRRSRYITDGIKMSPKRKILAPKTTQTINSLVVGKANPRTEIRTSAAPAAARPTSAAVFKTLAEYSSVDRLSSSKYLLNLDVSL